MTKKSPVWSFTVSVGFTFLQQTSNEKAVVQNSDKSMLSQCNINHTKKKSSLEFYGIRGFYFFATNK